MKFKFNVYIVLSTSGTVYFHTFLGICIELRIWMEYFSFFERILKNLSIFLQDTVVNLPKNRMVVNGNTSSFDTS